MLDWASRQMIPGLPDMKLCRVLPLLTGLLLAGCSYGIVSDQAFIDAENAARLPGLPGIYAPAGEPDDDKIVVELATEEPPRYRVLSAEEESGVAHSEGGSRCAPASGLPQSRS